MPIGGNRYDAVATVAGDGGKVPRCDGDFEFGITFTVKYIGTQDVAQPHNRVDIVAAMRRIRFECKARGIKKQKVNLTVSVKGIKVVLFRRNKKKYHAENFPIIEHPIYRIFYVSHDSHDLLIFSYISREASTNQFRCNVFKAFKKNHAIDVVRTVGQAFDICHRLAIEAELSDDQKNLDADNDTSDHTDADTHQQNGPCGLATCQNLMEPAQTSLDSGHSTGSEDVIRCAQRILAEADFKPSSIPATAFKAVGTITSPMAPLSLALTDDVVTGDDTLSGRCQIQLLLQRQKELHSQHMHCLLSQMQSLKDQLAAETDARINAQARIHQLLGQNQELLEHINALVQRLVQLEASHTVKAQLEIPRLPKIQYLPTNIVTSMRHLVRSSNAFTLPRAVQSPSSQVAVSVQNISPDSGHRELSTDSLSVAEMTATDVALNSWTRFPANSSHTLGRLPSFDVKQSLFLNRVKSPEVSQFVDDFCASHRKNFSSSYLPAVPGEMMEDKGTERNSEKEPPSPWLSSSSTTGTQLRSSALSMHPECKHNVHSKGEIVTVGSTNCALRTCNENSEEDVQRPVITTDSAAFADTADSFSTPIGGTEDRFLQDTRFTDVSSRIPGCHGNRVFIEGLADGNTVVTGGDVKSNSCYDDAWDQLCAVSCNSGLHAAIQAQIM